MQLDDNYRLEVERALVYAMIAGLENQSISSEALPNISNHILEGLPKAETHQQLMSFLEQMSEKWPIFATISNAEMARVIEKQKAGVIRDMLTLSREGKVDEALQVAHTLKPTQQL